MAFTHVPQDALEYAKEFVKGMPLERVATSITNHVARIMWMAAPWRWTLGSIPTFNLVTNTQDYTINYPSDWMYAVKAFVSSGTSPHQPLDIYPSLETAVGLVGNPSWIAYTGTAGQASGPVRVSPKPGQILTTQTVIGLYKKVMTTFTPATVHTATMPFDDEWFWVFEKGFLWQAYLYADDRRAGEAVFDGQSMKYNGQRGVFESALETMREREPLLYVDGSNADVKDGRK